MAEEVVLKKAEVEARLAELRQQSAIAYDSLLRIQGAVQEMEFVKRRFAEAVEAPPPKAGESECPPSSDSPPASSMSEAGAGPSPGPLPL